jgi:hypothetical protein
VYLTDLLDGPIALRQVRQVNVGQGRVACSAMLTRATASATIVPGELLDGMRPSSSNPYAISVCAFHDYLTLQVRQVVRQVSIDRKRGSG